jgi:hypothetical protein
MVTKKEVVEQRRNLKQVAERYSSFKKGDRRVFTPRLCVVCGRPLSSLILHEGKYITIHPHTRFHLNDWFIVDTCTDIQSCYRTLRKKGELNEDVDG